jgi:hypothetical protein
MKKKLIKVAIIIAITIITLINCSYAIMIPEKNIDIKIEDLTEGSRVYALVPTELLDYNMSKFLENNLENEFLTEKEKADKIKRYYDEHDYLKYMDYYIAEGYECGDYEIELRHYCFCIGKSEIVGMIEHNGKNYVQIKLNMSPDNSFLIITKDYLLNYDIRDIIIYIDEYGIDTYIDLNNYNYTKNGTNNLIDEIKLNYKYTPQEDIESINKMTQVAYMVLSILALLLALFVLWRVVKRDKERIQEEKARRFWEKNPTKEELKEQKKKEKEEKKKNKKKK